ncbi:hypothetical protein IMG5_103090 [Ichthyophthirius multifiliis]|uniref:P-loop containing nucleoside triphosphate hydrolase n=1 Tax=Ichthyophthirius multifiliis TaxID=5932 RepID=G0QSR6_ICHMU|nr:hypothetical protein IMG5_103090 [Ichthyophthirius multifiliis]EGR31735.1 hypothetical protein IMG5_103090 [Ichthyophthirius multifiliis]|eukprot:XP_004035221.1 hypothetical protein IMG5_103090 [Ichthyophthirius multifiliis]
MSQKIFINNMICEQQGESLLQLTYNIKINQTCQESLIKIWKLFHINYSGYIQREQFQKYVQILFKFLVNIQDKELLIYIAKEEINKICTHNDKEQLSFEFFCEFFANLAVRFIENLNIQSYQSFLDLIYDRTTTSTFRNVYDNSQIHLNYKIKVYLYNRDQIEEQFSQSQRNDFPQYIVYFEEQVLHDQQLFLSLNEREDLVLERNIIDENQIIPLGFSAENAIHAININNFAIPNSEFFHLPQKNIHLLEQVKLVIACENQHNLIKSLEIALNQNEVIQMIGCLGAHLQKYQQNVQLLHRINSYLGHPFATESLRNKTGIESKFNILSDFYSIDDLEVDQIDQLHKKQKLRNAQRRKLIDTENKKRNKKRPKDLKEYIRTLDFNLIKQIQNHIDQSKLKISLKELKQENQKQNSDHTLQFRQFISKGGKIPQDTLDAYKEDVLEYANKRPLQMLVMGKPKTGKSKFCSLLQKKIDIIHIEAGFLIEKLMIRVKENEANATEEEPDKSLPWEKEIVKELLEGKSISGNNLIELINNELQNDLPQNKGFILDVPLCFSQGEVDWIDAIIKNKVALPKIGCRYFSHIIEFSCEDDDVLKFGGSVMELYGENLKIFSEREREISRQPKKRLNDDGEEVPEEEEANEEDEEGKKPLFENEMLYRPCEVEQILKEHLNQYNNLQRKRANEFLQHLTENEHIVVNLNGQSDEELVEYIYQCLGDEVQPLRPLAVKLDGGSEKDLLTQGLEETKMVRKWSPWQQVDPVELSKGRLLIGKGEFACDYAGRVFLFENEENQNAFERNARKYLQKEPQLPKTYNIAIIGPRQSGKKTMANKLADQYGFLVVDLEAIIGEILEWQKQQEIEIGQHIVSNFDSKINHIHFSAEEWKDIQKGGLISAKDIWPIVLHKLGITLQKKPENWGVEKNEDEQELDEEAKAAAEQAAKKAATKKAQMNKKGAKKEVDDERPVTPPIEDLSLKNLIQVIQPDGKLKPVQGLCIIGYPTNEQEISMLKYHNILLDKIIVLNDKGEEEEGKVLKTIKNMEDQVLNIENEVKYITDATAVLKEQYSEDSVKEIPIEGTELEVYNRIRVQLDPFFIRFDTEELARYPADVGEEDDPITWGEYGSYCPIIFKDEQWLVPGRGDNEVIVRGKRHKFYSEEQKKKFQENTWKYVDGSHHLELPPPRILLMGVRGSGLHTQLQKLYEKYKIPVMDLKQNLINHILNEKEKRRQDRVFQKGFKPQEKDEEGNIIEDPEIKEEAADFDKRIEEIRLMKLIMSDVKQVFINGNFFDLEEDLISMSLPELLSESRKLPECVLLLKVDEKNFMERQFNQKEIEDLYNKKMEERRLEKQREKERLRQEKLAELAANLQEGEEMPQLEEEEEEPEDQEDPEAPNLLEMINEKKAKLTEQRESDLAKLEEYKTAFEDLGIQVIEITCERSIQHVFDKITYNLKPFLEERQNKLEQQQTYVLKKPQKEENEEEEKPFRLQYFEKSYTYRKSRFGEKNPLSLLEIPKIKDFPLLYRDRIYYFHSEEEVLKASKEPLKYIKNNCFPKDVNIKPIVFVIGKPKTGKSTLSKIIEEQLGIVRIKLSSVLEDYGPQHPCLTYQNAREVLQQGESLSDQQVVDLVLQRVQMADCKASGWVLDGLPQNKQQAILFQQKGVVPYAVLSLQLNDSEIKKRAQKQTKNKNKFGYNQIILHEKLQACENDILENFYLTTFNNVRFLDAKISKWGVFDLAKLYIGQTTLSRQQFSRALITNEPVNIGQLGLTINEILQNMSTFKNISPVALKTKKFYVQNNIRHPFIAYFDGYIYVLDNEQELHDFLNRPDLYVYQYIDDDLPSKVPIDNIIEKYNTVNNKGYCTGFLRNDQLKKSQPSLLVEYKGGIYSFSSTQYQVRFKQMPQDYENIKLHDKLPVQFDPLNLVKKVAKKGDCTAFLEHHLGNIVMRVLAQLGYKRIKYPTLNCKETALKYIAISLKACNPNKDENYRQKYQQRLQQFIKHCYYSEEMKEEQKRKSFWNDWDEENLLKITKEFKEFMDTVESNDKEVYFERFIR